MAASLQEHDPPLLTEPAQPLSQLFHHGILPRTQLAEADFGLTETDSALVGLADLTNQLRGVQQGLRGNAAVNEANSSEALFPVHQDNLVPFVRGIKSRRVAARARADNNNLCPDRIHPALSLELAVGKFFQHSHYLQNKAHSVRSVHHAMVIGKSEREHRARFDLSIFDYGLQGCPSDPQHGDLGLVDDRSEMTAADPALVGNRKAPSLQFFQRDFPPSRPLYKAVEFGREIRKPFFVYVSQHWNNQSRLGVDRNTDMIIILIDNLPGRFIQTGIEDRILFQGRDHRLQDERSQGEVLAFLLQSGAVFFSQSRDTSDIDLLQLSDVGDGRPGIVHPLADGASDRGDRLLLNLAPVGKIDGF